MSIEIECHGATHVGRHRSDNEDQFLIADLNKSMKVHQTSLGLNHQTRLMGESQGKLLLVADGVGGHASGERASSLAVDCVANYILNAMDWFLRLNDENEAELVEELKDAFHSQSESSWRRSNRDSTTAWDGDNDDDGLHHLAHHVCGARW